MTNDHSPPSDQAEEPGDRLWAAEADAKAPPSELRRPFQAVVGVTIVALVVLLARYFESVAVSTMVMAVLLVTILSLAAGRKRRADRSGPPL